VSAEKSRPLPGTAPVIGEDDNRIVTAAGPRFQTQAEGGDQFDRPAMVAVAESPLSRRPDLFSSADLVETHCNLLNASGIDLDVAVALGVRSVLDVDGLPDEFRRYGDAVLPGLVIPWHGMAGHIVPQLRPDVALERPDGSRSKYLFPGGSIPPLQVHPMVRDRLALPETDILLVEGSKQVLSAVSALRDDPTVAPIGMAGCFAWSHAGQPTPDFRAVPWHGRTVYLLLDADRTANRNVYDAAIRVADQLKTLFGVAKVKYVALPAGGKTGLDDVLGPLDRAQRSAALRRILQGSDEKPGPRPRGTKGDFHDEHGVRVKALADDIAALTPLAVGPDGAIWAYGHGYYQPMRLQLSAEIGRRLGDSYRSLDAKAVVEFLTGQLFSQGRILPERPHTSLMNVPNGMLNPFTGELQPHSPDFFSFSQIPVAWDPEALAPRYVAWMATQIGHQSEDLEEVAATMLDPSRTPTKAAFLYGPARSGKSTFLRLMTAIAGRDNTSAVTLHQLSGNRFAAANLYGKILNCAADLSGAHVEDISMFKMLTGGDLITAERKFMAQFTFTNRALFAFSANEIPSVGETSRAYLERIKPFRFAASFAGAEDPNVEQALIAELSGILVCWVAALRRLRDRGSFLPTAPNVLAEFAQQSDRVQLFLAQMTVPDELGTARAEVHLRFETWARNNNGHPLGRNKFYERVRLAGVEEYNHRQTGRCFRVKVIDPDRMPTATGAEPVDGGSCGSLPQTSSKTSVQKSVSSAVGGSGETATTATAFLDLETGSADQLYIYKAHDAQGYVRLAAVNGHVSSNISATLRSLAEAEEIVGHNILRFDLPALARYHGADFRSLAAKARDTFILSRLDDPPLSRTGEGRADRGYGLNALALQKLGLGKLDNLKELAEHYGGYDRIPLEEPEYHSYTRRDCQLSTQLAAHYPMTPYGAREHQVLAIGIEMCMTGFRVDEAKLRHLLKDQVARREQLLSRLRPLGVDGRSKAPHQTKPGKEALASAFSASGVELPLTRQGQCRRSSKTWPVALFEK
jgi:putative DNA primase/helicase